MSIFIFRVYFNVLKEKYTLSFILTKHFKFLSKCLCRPNSSGQYYNIIQTMNLNKKINTANKNTLKIILKINNSNTK